MDQATDLRALVREVASSHAPTAAAHAVKSPRRIVVCGGKGGVGATTVAVNLSVALARQGSRCLLCDAAGGGVALQLRIEPRRTLADVLAGHRSLEAVLAPGPAGVQIVPGTSEVPPVQVTMEHAWNRLLGQMPGLALRPDVVVIDAGSQPTPLARQLWQTADRVLLVSTPETAAIMSAYASIKLLNDPARLASIALLLNRLTHEAEADEAQQRLVQACRRFLGLPLRSVGAVPEDAHVGQCAARGEPFVLAVPACAASLAVRHAARAMLNNETTRRTAVA